MKLRRSAAILAGGTGGHVFAGLALAEELQDRDISVFFLGSRTGLERDLVTQAGLQFLPTASGAIRNASLISKLLAVISLAVGICNALALFLRHRPGCVVSMGCFTSAPGGVAAFLLRIPLLVHEQNLRPGLTNRCLARLTREVYWAMEQPESYWRDARYCPSPLRREILDQSYRWAPRKPACILVLGGSAGSSVLNECLPESLHQLALRQALRVIHQTGNSEDCQAVQLRYQALEIDAECVPFIGDMAGAYAQATIVISLAGALSIAEMEAADLPAILVPIANSPDQHQLANARAAENRGYGVVLTEDQLSERLVDELVSLLPRLKNQGNRLRRPHYDQGARILASACERVIRHA